MGAVDDIETLMVFHIYGGKKTLIQILKKTKTATTFLM